MYDIKLKVSACLSCVEVTNCVKFQIPRYMYKGFKVSIFLLQESNNIASENCHNYTAVTIGKCTYVNGDG